MKRASAESATPREWNATSYHRVATPHITWGRSVLARLPLRGDETVIDAGCGTGRLTAELLEALPSGRVLALDQSANMLAAARDYLTPRFGDQVSFFQVDLHTLMLDQIAEAIFSTATFHWLPDHPRLFANLFRALRPGGWLVAQCGGGPNLAALRARAAILMARPPFAAAFAGWPGPWEFAGAAETAERLRAAGFSEIETSLEAAPTVLSDAVAYTEFLTSVIFGTHLARLPNESSRAAFIAPLTTQAATDDPPFSLDYWRLNLRGRRTL
ncbi:MAG: methyltransferase domain-containing protein [Chloroflexota bacterium]|nr:methyltransferase domain-containing protein [Chloroflexota bacterium]